MAYYPIYNSTDNLVIFSFKRCSITDYLLWSDCLDVFLDEWTDDCKDRI